MSELLPVFSVFPFAVFLIFLLFKKTSLLIASVSAFVSALIAGLFIWRIFPIIALASLIKGFLVAFDIFLIIFGALFFLETLKSMKVIDSISYYLESFSKDYRIKVIILAWFFENFLEGTAGFGTAGVIIAPLLVSLGLSPIKAVIISLLGNSTAVAFGAAGTPIRIGFLGLNISSVPFYTALINCLGFIVPVFILMTLVADQKDKKEQFWEIFPFAVWSGIVFVIPSVFTVFLGQEFPSILGSVVGLLLIFLTSRLGIFMPKSPRILRPEEKPKEIQPLFKDIFPYVLLIALLILGKFLLNGSINFVFLNLKHTFNYFNPGLCFIIAGSTVTFLFGKEKKLAPDALFFALKKAIEPFLIIVSMSGFVQLMINSGDNFSGFPSMLKLTAANFETALLPFWSPFIGAFGSFITGSATVSNLMFGNFLNFAAQVMNMNVAIILALELVGASAGNMIALADMISAETVVGLKNEERKVLKGVIIPCLIYVLLAGIIGILVAS